MSDYTRIKLRRSTANDWSGVNPVLDLGEAGYETDFKRLKVGDGVTPWSGLDYIQVHPSSINFPNIGLRIGDGYDQRINLSLSNQEILNIQASGDTTLDYNNSTKTLIFNTQAGSSSVTRTNVINALGYTPQISGQYSLINHGHNINNINNLQSILDSKQPTGNYATSSHNHNLRISIGDGRVLNYNSNEILNITSSGYASINIDDYTNTLIISAIGNSGVTKFNNRQGDISLNYVDVTGALSYIPQPTGNYAFDTHTHTVDQIADLWRLGWTYQSGTQSWSFDYPPVSNIQRRTPLSSIDSGNPGDICWDISYLYICIGLNTWRRLPHSTW